MKTWQPLAGIRVLSFELAFALPAGTRALHDLGAEVVRVSPPARQVDRYIGFIDGVFQGKSSISVDLTKAAGRDIAQRLAAEADVVCNNFRPGVLEKYGMGAAALREQHPELITLQLSGYGTPGPWASYPAFGPSTEAAGGLNRLLVNEGEVPIRVGPAVFSDQLAGRYAALALIAALEERRQTGMGAALDLSMTACITHMLGQPMTEALCSGAVPQNQGNRDRRRVPQGLYRCAPEAPGEPDDEWLAVSVANQAQWRALLGTLAEAVGADQLDPDWDAQQRWQHHDRIDAALGKFCQGCSKNVLAEMLQGLGVPAAPVRTVMDQALDPNLQARGSLPLLRHRQPVLGYSAHPHPVLPWRIVGRARRKLQDYRHTGEDNARVLHGWLGLTAAEIRALTEKQVLYAESPLDLRSPRKGRNHDPLHAQKLGLPEARAHQRGALRAASQHNSGLRTAPDTVAGMCVLELSETSAAGYAGALLAAQEIVVARIACGACAAEDGEQDEEQDEASGLFLHSAKAVLEQSSPASQTAASVDVAAYDVLVEDIGARGLKKLGWSYRKLRAAHPQLIIISLSPFGRRGSYAQWQGSELLAQAVGGVLHTTGYAGETPRMLPGDAAFMIAGLHAATAAFSAFFGLRRGSEEAGIHIDISAQDTLMQHWTRHVADYAYSGTRMGREPRDPQGLHRRHTAPANDGWVYLLALREPWQDLAAFLGLGDFIPPEAWEPRAVQPDWARLESAFHAAVASKSKYEWFADAAGLGWTFAPVQDPFEIAASPQVAARGGMATVRSTTQKVSIPPLPWSRG